ncbi:MAG TPA: response regulator [Pseudolabrys sp.]|nr:response regulator [Pseudolabrys sp.]
MTSRRAIQQSWPSQERRAAPRRGPARVFARDDAVAGARQLATPASVLIVEDDYLVATEIEAALAAAGFEVAGVAVSAEEAIELAAARRPQLVIMDIRLAGERDGIDAALALFKRFGIRSIFATAHSDQEARRRAQAADPLGWLQKPYTTSSLVQLVRWAVNELEGGR